MRNLFLWLHIAIAIVAFGPTFTFPVWMHFAGKEGPPIVPFAIRTITTLFHRVILPLAVVLPFTGVVLIYVSKIPLWESEWLIVAIVLYTVSFTLAVGVGLPNIHRVIALMSGGPPGQEAMAEIQRRARRQRVIGYTNNALFLAILFLMVAKPGA